MTRLWLWGPLALFIVFVAVVATGLFRPDDRVHRSCLIGQAMPAFTLPAATAERPGLATRDLLGKPRLINVFASWCVPCIAEAPLLGELARRGVIVDGIAIRDRPDDLTRFLARNGNPYRAIGSDVTSQVQISLGSSGVPETFVVDRRGIIRHQHIGEIKPSDVPVILAKLNAAL